MAFYGDFVLLGCLPFLDTVVSCDWLPLGLCRHGACRTLCCLCKLWLASFRPLSPWWYPHVSNVTLCRLLLYLSSPRNPEKPAIDLSCCAFWRSGNWPANRQPCCPRILNCLLLRLSLPRCPSLCLLALLSIELLTVKLLTVVPFIAEKPVTLPLGPSVHMSFGLSIELQNRHWGGVQRPLYAFIWVLWVLIRLDPSLTS